MSVIESPDNPLTQMEVDHTFSAARVSLWPHDFQRSPHFGGHYAMSIRTGLVTAVAAAGAIFSLRWTNAQFAMILHRLSVSANIATAFGAAQELSLDMVRLINYSAADTGGTLIDPLLKTACKDTHMAASQISSIRVATTAALTNGTATVDSAVGTAFSEEAFPINTVGLGSSAKIDMVQLFAPGSQCPLILNANEGFRVRILQAMGATGVVVFHFNMEWAEVPNELFPA